MKNTLLILQIFLFAGSMSLAQNVDSFTVSNDTVRSCTDPVTLVNHSTNYDYLDWIVTGPGGVISNLPHDTFIKFFPMYTGCYDIKLLIWRNGISDSTIQYCAVYCLPPKLVYLQGKEVDTIEVFMSYIDSGYIANDNCSGIKNQGILGSVNPNVVGKNVLKYYAVNNAGFSDTAIRTVYVVDRIAPVIALVGPDTMYSDKGCQFVDPGVKISDNYYGLSDLSIGINNTVDSNSIGNYEIKYWTVDGSGNSSDTVRRVVIIQDINPPELAADTAYVEVYHAYKPNIIFKHKCCTLAESEIYMSGNVDTSHLGIYTSQIWIQDCVGNISDTISQIVIVGDTTPPVISVRNCKRVYNIYRYDTLKVNPVDSAEVIDNYDSFVKLEVSGTYYSDFLKNHYLGLYTIRFDATDSSGNKAEQYIIYVNADWIGINEADQPIFTIFPNPSNGQFTLDLNEAEPATYIRIFDMSGKQIMSFDEPKQKNEIQMPVHCKGVYIVQVGTAKGIYTSRLMVR